jgi:hypothetical protein
MHTTDTIDFEVVLRGEVILQLDDGAERVLRGRHRGAEWHAPPLGNRDTEPAVVAAFPIGAHRAST